MHRLIQKIRMSLVSHATSVISSFLNQRMFLIENNFV